MRDKRTYSWYRSADTVTSHRLEQRKRERERERERKREREREKERAFEFRKSAQNETGSRDRRCDAIELSEV